MNLHEYEMGIRKHEIDTPALIIDLDIMDRNLATMAAYFAGVQAKLRPHVKLHKATPILAYKQLEAGGYGVTCAKLSEAEIMAAAGIKDILIANQIVGERKIQRLVNLATYADVMVAVDNADNIDALSRAAQTRNIQVRVLVEVNIGHNRCGVAPFEPTLQLARLVHNAPGLRFMGIMGYDGHCTLRVTASEREGKSHEANMLLAKTREYLEEAGLPVEIVSAGGTFTYKYATAIPGITEIQAGTYLLMDTTFQENGVTDFECALTVLGTVTSRPPKPAGEELAIIDVGRKTFATEWGLPRVKQPQGATVTSMSQEHGRMKIDKVNGNVCIGDKVELWVRDASCTINLYDKFYAVRGDIVVAVWDIPGRGAST